MGGELVERALREGERLFRTLFECSALPTVIANADGILLEVNRAARQALGLAPEALARLSLADVTPSPARARCTTFIIPGDLVVLMWEDVTEARRAEARLQQQAEVLDLVPAAVMVLALDETVTLWTRGAEGLYGWTAGEVAGRDVHALIGAEPEGTRAERRERLARHGDWSGTVRHRARGGGERVVASRWRQMRDAKGNAMALLVVDLDVTEQRQLEAQLATAQRMESIGFLAAGVAHDFNNVLAPILMAATELASATADERTRAIAANIEESARRGAAVVRQMLVFAQGEEGHRSLLAVRHMVEATVRLLRETLTRSIVVNCDVPDRLDAVEGDPTQMAQVLMALCVNARDAMPDGGTLEITAANRSLDELFCAMNGRLEPGRYVAIRVRDTGVGIPKDRISRIFEPYFTTKGPGKGTGMGLSVAAGLVRGHGGCITVASEPGRGTSFTVLLPAMPALQPAPEPGYATAAPEGHGETVLVVDDEELYRELAAKVLERGGYRVLTAKNGVEGVAEYARQAGAVAAVLMDMNMPDMDGRTAIRLLRTMDPHARILVATGSLGMDRGAVPAELAPLPRLCKPFDRAALLTAVDALIHGA